MDAATAYFLASSAFQIGGSLFGPDERQEQQNVINLKFE